MKLKQGDIMVEAVNATEDCSAGIRTWMENNLQKLNQNKNVLSDISSKQGVAKLENFLLKISSNYIEYAKSAKFLVIF